MRQSRSVKRLEFVVGTTIDEWPIVGYCQEGRLDLDLYKDNLAARFKSSAAVEKPSSVTRPTTIAAAMTLFKMLVIVIDIILFHQT